MKRIAFVSLILAFLVAPVWAADSGVEVGLRLVSLDEAVSLAFENSLSLEMSRLTSKRRSSTCAQTRATNLVQPSPTSLIQAERQVEIAGVSSSWTSLTCGWR